MFASLDRGDQSVIQRETLTEMRKSTFSSEIKDPEQELEELLEADDNYQDAKNNQSKASAINLDLARELYATLMESDGQFFNMSGTNRYIDWGTQDVSYKVLRRAGATEAGRLIKNKRRLDLAQFARTPRRNEVQRGAILEFCNPNYQPSKEERAKLNEWQQQIFTNFFFAANDVFPNFARFIGNAYEDWFDLDDMTFEIRRNGLGDPLAIHIQDPMLYKPVIKKRRAPVTFDRGNPLEEYLRDYETMITGELKLEEDDEPDYLLIHNQQRLAGVYLDDVRKHHFFIRSDYRAAQRGYSIVEQSMTILTYILNALKMNAGNFTNNRMPPGFVAFTGGGVGILQLEKLKKILWAYMTGAQNSNRFPMISLKGEKGDAKWISIRNNSREMEYHLWMTLLFSIFCQLSGTDPREVSLGSHSDAVGKKSLFEESSDGIIRESKDTGAKTFLTHLEDSLNTPASNGKNMFQELTGMDLRIRFLGFEMIDKKMKYDIREKELKTDKSLNEILTEEDKEKSSLVVGGIDLFEVKALNNQTVFSGLQTLIQQNTQKEAMVSTQQNGGQGTATQQLIDGGGGQGAPGDEEERNKKPLLTDADKELLAKYGGKAGVDIDEELRKQLTGEE